MNRRWFFKASAFALALASVATNAYAVRGGGNLTKGEGILTFIFWCIIGPVIVSDWLRDNRHAKEARLEREKLEREREAEREEALRIKREATILQYQQAEAKRVRDLREEWFEHRL